MAGAAVVGCTQLDAWQREAIFSPAQGDQRWFSEPPAGTRVFDLAGAPDQHGAPGTGKAPIHGPRPSSICTARAGTSNGSAFRMASWTRLGYSVLAIDYRGFGDSTRILPSEESAGQDAIAALRELARRQPEPSRRFVYGHSLGGAIAIDLASAQGYAAVRGADRRIQFHQHRRHAADPEVGWVPGTSLLVTQPLRFPGQARAT